MWPTLILSQGTDPTGGWDSIFAVYGPFAPFAIFCIAVIKILWDSLKESRAENKKLTETMINDVLPLVLTSTKTVEEASKVIQQQEDVAASIIEVGEKLDEVLPILKRLDRPVKKAAPRRKATKRT